MWRTVIVTKGERLTIRDNWLIVYSEDTENLLDNKDILEL